MYKLNAAEEKKEYKLFGKWAWFTDDMEGGLSMVKISKENLGEIEIMVKEEFPEDPALQQVHIARKILAKEAENTGLSYLDYVKKVANQVKENIR
jgi:hypothetical protein